jgi:DNA-binding ferritin-like protein (Dps family)
VSDPTINRTALIQVLGAIAYGEWKAYEGAVAKAEAAAVADDDGGRRAWRTTAAEELRHYKGFVRRLEALGADPTRAMRPYRSPLDRYHGGPEGDAIEEAVWSFMGEGVADDLLRWFRTVADQETAAFIDSVLVDEEHHEARAAAELRALLGGSPRRRLLAARAARRMVQRMVLAGQPAPLRFAPFLQLGRGPALLSELIGGQVRRLRAIGVLAAGMALP